MPEIPIVLILFLALLAAVFYDWRERRIPNFVSLGGTALVLFSAFIFGGWPGFINHLLGALIVGGVWFLFWQFRFIGGGDQKLMLLLGAALGRGLSLSALLLVSLSGALQAVITVALRRRDAPFFSRERWRQTEIPYSVSIAFGAWLVIFGAAAGLLPGPLVI